MTKKDLYIKELQELPQWDEYLLANSNLPGPRANLELMQAFIEVGDEATFLRYIDITSIQAPVDNPGEFLPFCGTVGLGKLIVSGQAQYFKTLRELAGDPRWRIREAVAWALQICGEKDCEFVIQNIIDWAKGNFLEQRALVAGLSHPSVVHSSLNAIKVLSVLDYVTRSVTEVENRQDEDFRILRKGLAYCWSVIIVAYPEAGKTVFEELLHLNDPDILWIIKENLKKNRLVKMDKEWVARIVLQISPEL